MTDNPIRLSVREMNAYTPGEQPSGPNVIKLNTNENPYPPSPDVAAAINGISAETLRLYPDPVCSELRKRIGEIHSCPADSVLVGNGSDEVLALCSRAFVENDGSIGYFKPSYSLYPVISAIRDATPVPVELDDSFQWRDPPADGISLFFLTNPNAPTGILYPREDIEKFCKSFKGVVVLDEAYVDFAARDCMDFALGMDNVIVVRTLSKSYSLAAARLGYAVACPELIEALFKIKDSYNVNMLTQKAALAALSDVDHAKHNIARIIATRTKLTAALEKLGYSVIPSQSNFVFARPPDRDAARIFEALRIRNIFVRYFPGKNTGEYLRITVGTDPQIETLLEALEQET